MGDNHEDHEYPDPGDTPSFAWAGVKTVTAAFEEVDDYMNDLDMVAPDVFAPDEDSQNGTSFFGPDGGVIDPDFQYQDDSDKSDDDELISEADSDFEAPAPATYPESQSKVKKSGRGSRARGRGRGRGRGHGALGFDSGIQRRRGRPKGQGRGGKGIKRGIRKPVEPSPEFKSLHSQATLAFIEKDYDAAEELAKQAIQCNPEIFTAYSLLSEIHMARGDRSRATHALFNGAHTRPRDTALWSKVAKLIMEIAGDDRASAYLDAIYCYNRVIGSDSSHVEARYERAALHREFGNERRAAYDYVRLLRLLPHDTTVLRNLAEVYIEIGEGARAMDYYETSIAHFQSLQQSSVTPFTWSDLNIYAELFMYSTEPGEIAKGISKIKSVCRWLLNRGEDEFWDNYTHDDREFDATDDPRRLLVPEFDRDRHDLGSYGNGLPLEIRTRLGLLRLELGEEHFEEAIRHFEWLAPKDTGPGGMIHDYPDLFGDIAEALRLCGLPHEALRFYEPLQQLEEYISISFFKNMGSCYHALELYDEAEESFRIVLENNEDNVEILLKLATMFENADMPDRAEPYVERIIALKRARALQKGAPRPRSRADASTKLHKPIASASKQTMLDPMAGRKPDTRPRNLKRLREAELNEKVQLLYRELMILKQQIEDGESEARVEWMGIAKTLIDEFKKKKSFYSAGVEKHRKYSGYPTKLQLRDGEEMETVTGRLEQLLDNVQEEVEYTAVEYCNVSFGQWLDIFLEYAVVLAKGGDKIQAYETIISATEAKVFHDSKELMFLIHVTWSICALAVDDDETLCGVARYFMKEFQFVTDTYRLFSILNRLCNRQNVWYNNGPTQKYILRQVKAVDFSLMSEERRKNFYEERASYSTKDAAGNPIHAEEMDIALLMAYGYILFTGGSHTFALNYFYRAYALDPGNPMIILSLALGYLHVAIKRQSGNRQYMIMQGFSFLFKYYDLRKRSEFSIERQESEYNVGRAYHMLGLTHLAIPYYERCLNMSREVQRDGGLGPAEDYSVEAAFALQLHWAASGEVELAQKLTARWLVI